MRPPPKNISILSDFEGHRILSWQAMHPVQARLIAALMLVVAALLWISLCEIPLTLRRLLQAKGLTWLGLAATLPGTAFLIVPTLGAVIALRVMFRPEPESITLEPARLVYRPGSAIMAFGSNMLFRPAFVWGSIRGKAQVNIAREDFQLAERIVRRDRTDAVALQLTRETVCIGRWLGKSEQLWLAETLTEWKSGT